MSRHHKHSHHEKSPAPVEPAAAESPGTPPAAPETPDPAAAVAAERAALQDRLLRLQADFENLRKRTARERQELVQRATEDLMLELLPVLDHFELGLAAAAQQGLDPATFAGFQLVRDQLHGVLERFGLSRIEAVGQTFDPHLHEAVTVVPSEEHPRDHVLLEIRRGYRLGERLLRAAQVGLAAGPEAPAPEAPPPAEPDNRAAAPSDTPAGSEGGAHGG